METKKKPYSEMSAAELEQELQELKKEYYRYQGMDMNLDMSRGKPCREQLDLSMGMMDVLNSSSDLVCEDGTDCRNYGVLTGIDEAKELMSDMMENNPDNIIIFGLTAEEAMNYYTYGGYNPVEQAAIDGRLNRMMTQLIDGTLKDETYGAELSSENRLKAQKAVQSADKYAAMLVDRGSLEEVDVISGATISYNEFVEAVKDALSKAEK